MLLAANQEWQASARAEVLEICKNNLPDAGMLRNMKTLTMVIQETMRLYPPVVFVIRRAQQDLKFKYITIPKGMNIQIPIPVAQQNPDAHQFNPKRFAKGVLGERVHRIIWHFGCSYLCRPTLCHGRADPITHPIRV